MTRSIDSITHTPNKYVKITINCADGEEDVKVTVNTARATVTAQYKYTPTEALMATEHTSADDDRSEAYTTIRDAPQDSMLTTTSTGRSTDWNESGTGWATRIPCCLTTSDWMCTATTNRSVADKTCFVDDDGTYYGQNRS